MTNSVDKARIEQLEADNRRLRTLHEQHDAPGELRHRLRSTLAVLRTIIRRSSLTASSVENYAAHLEDRLDAVARAQSLADENGTISLHKLISDELLYYAVNEGHRATIHGPPIELQPKAGQIFALAIHELTSNAIVHGRLGSEGQVNISWTISGDHALSPVLVFEWWEPNEPFSGSPTFSGFGTEVLKNALPYELKAQTTLDFEPDGLRCVIRLPLIAKTGFARGS